MGVVGARIVIQEGKGRRTKGEGQRARTERTEGQEGKRAKEEKGERIEFRCRFGARPMIVSVGNKGCLIYESLTFAHHTYIMAGEAAGIDWRTVLPPSGFAHWSRTAEWLANGALAGLNLVLLGGSAITS